jgi:hypothetical protein
MVAHSGPVIALLALLALAGVYKVADPVPTSGALRAAGLPSSIHLVRALGVVEIAVGTTGILAGSALASLAGAVLYAGFLVFVLEALRRRLPISSCGCLGAAETPPTVAHVMVNLTAVVTLALGSLFPIGELGGLLDVPVMEAVAFLLFIAATVYLLQAVLTVLPLRQAVRRSAQVAIQAKAR